MTVVYLFASTTPKDKTERRREHLALSGRRVVQTRRRFLRHNTMTLDNVISAAFLLSRQERHILFQTIAVADNWGITVDGEWIDATKAETAQESKALKPANNRKSYTTEELIKLHEIASRMDTDSSFGHNEQREAITEAAKRLGRTYKAIAEKIRTIRAE